MVEKTEDTSKPVQIYDPNIDFAEPEFEIVRNPDGLPEIGSATKGATGVGVPLETRAVTPFMPRDTEDLKGLVRVIVKGGCVPAAYMLADKRTPDMSKMAVGILAGREVGWGPLTSLQFIMVVRGMPAVWGKGAKGLIHNSGRLVEYRLVWIDRRTFQTIPDSDTATRARLIEEGYTELCQYGRTIHMAKTIQLPEHDVHVSRWGAEIAAYVMAYRKDVPSPFIGTFSVGDARRAQLWANPKKDPWIKYPQDMLEHKAAARCWDRGFADCLTGLSIREILEERGIEDDETAPVNTSFLGGPPPKSPPSQEAPPSPAQQAAAERDLLITSLEKCATRDALELWFQAAGGRIEMLVGAGEEGAAYAVEVNQAYLKRKKSLERGDG